MATTYGMGELLAAMVQAFGSPRPTSFGLGELLEDLILAIQAFVAGGGTGGLGPGFVPVTGLTNDGGSSDQSTRFAAAAALLPAQGGILFIPSGTFGCSWQVPVNVHLFGAGMGGQNANSPNFCDGATILCIPKISQGGNTPTSSPLLYCLDTTGKNVALWNLDVDGSAGFGAGIADPAGKLYTRAVTAAGGSDQKYFNVRFNGGGYSSFESFPGAAGWNRPRLTNASMNNISSNVLARTITATISGSAGSTALTDSAGSFSAADVGRAFSPFLTTNTNTPGPGPNTPGIMHGTRIIANATYLDATNTVGNIAGLGTMTLNSTTNLPAAPAQVSLQIQKTISTGIVHWGLVTFAYTGINPGVGLTGVSLIGVSPWADNTFQVASGANVVSTTQARLSQTLQLTLPAGSTASLVEGYAAITSGTDLQATACRFEQGTHVCSGVAAALQFEQCHYTNTENSPNSIGNILSEGTNNFSECYIDSCPPNGHGLIHAQGANQDEWTGGYIYQNSLGGVANALSNTFPWLYCENDTSSGVTFRDALMQPPQGQWQGLCLLNGGQNPGVKLQDFDCQGNMPFLITTSLTAGVASPTTLSIWGLTATVNGGDTLQVADRNGHNMTFTTVGATHVGALTMSVVSATPPAGWVTGTGSGYLAAGTANWNLQFNQGPGLSNLFGGPGAGSFNPYGTGRVSNIMVNNVQIDANAEPDIAITVPVAANHASIIPGLTDGVYNITNNSAAAMTITLNLRSAYDSLVDGQPLTLRIFDATNATQAITWVNTENSPPGNTAGSTTVPLVCQFTYNILTSAWHFQSSSGGGAVSSVTAADASATVVPTTGAVTVATGTLDRIAALHAATTNWSNNSVKITSLANGTVSTDAAAFGQIPTTTALPYAVNRVSTNQTMTANQVYVATASCTLALPGSPTAGMWNIVKSITSGTVTITGTVDTVVNPTITTQYQSDTMIYDGTVWNFV